MYSAHTENGAVSLATTGNPHVDYFFKVLRDTSDENIQNYLESCWNVNPLRTVKLIFHARDCRGGKGEKRIFIESYKWLIEKNLTTSIKNLQHISYYGTYKDLLQLFGTEVQDEMITLYTKQLMIDYNKLQQVDNQQYVEISLAGKWAPTEGCSFDKKFKGAKLLAQKMNISMKHYRKMITTLRNHLKIVERYMCNKDWESINYVQVPSVAMNRHRKAFIKNDEERFNKYLANVQAGNTKIKALQVFPHEIVGQYMQTNEIDTVLEEQWKAIVHKGKENGNIGNSLVICDVSGSMFSAVGGSTKYQNVHVAIALTLFLSEICQGSFHKNFITFESNPKCIQVQGNTLKEQIEFTRRVSWGGSTNLQRTFDLILNTATTLKVPQDDMPKTVWIISDMQFNHACGNNATNFQEINRKYQEAGYKRPQLVFWNTAGRSVDFPTFAYDSGVALISGFSQNLIKLFMDGEELSPYQIMKKAIDDERYDRIII